MLTDDILSSKVTPNKPLFGTFLQHYMARDLAPEVLVLKLHILLKLHINNIVSHILGKGV